jgi:hypothetical protein
LVALMVLMALPMRAGAGQSLNEYRAVPPDAATESPAVSALLSSVDQTIACTRDDLLRAIQSDREVSKEVKHLLRPLASSPGEACEALRNTSHTEIETITSLQAHSAACGLRPRDLDSIIADHKDTTRLLYRVCSPTQAGQWGPRENPFEDFGRIPFPE